MTTLFALTVARNEVERYLGSMLAATADLVDEHFFFDDQSDDGTLFEALDAGCFVSYRSDPPSFLQHEGRFRQLAWNSFEDCCQPKPGDWVLAIDADEVLVSVGGGNCCLRCEVDQAIDAANQLGAKSVRIPIPEVFGFDDDGTPLVRTDGYWGSIAGTRLFRYERNGVFRDKAMGSGSEPTYVADGRISERCFGLRIMHFGYSQVADQLAKHERYTALLDHGHSNSHVQSIIGPKSLARWEGPVPSMVYGGRA